jgi:hypothetical protein
VDVRYAILFAMILGLVACGQASESSESSSADLADGDDGDQDGISDALEEQLIRRYRPFYKFTKEGDRIENNRPADPMKILADSQLKLMKGDNDVSGPIDGCNVGSYECKSDASFSASPQASMYCLDIPESDFDGVSADEAEAQSTGFYGHVVKDTIGGHDAYKIEYWQFWGFNNQDITIFGKGSFGDHQGDWTGLELWYDLTTKSIAKMGYLIHGNEVVFTMPESVESCGTDCFQTIKGSHYDMNLGSFFDDKELPKYSDNAAEIYFDDRGDDHTVVYIERGGHEFWPGPWGKPEIDLGPITVTDNAHNGQGLNYLVNADVNRSFNLGEVDHPLTPEARTILQFNGHWGCTNAHDLFGKAPQRRSPIGPATHCEWHWPNNGKSAPGCEN